MRYRTLLCIILFSCNLRAQVHEFPFSESFDTIAVPELPDGWTTTTNRSLSGDFASTTSVAHSAPNAVLSTDATKPQSLISPLLDFSDLEPDSVFFYERRSSSHNSGLILEASTDGGTSFSIAIGDTLKYPGTTGYVLRALKLPDSLSNKLSVRFRWRVVGNGNGATGTIRFDDIEITARSEFDLALSGMRATLSPTNNVTVAVTVWNTGRAPAADFHVKLFNDANGDSLARLSELLDEKTVSASLAPNESTHVSFDLSSSGYGRKSFIGVVEWENDHSIANNSLYRILSIPYPSGSLVINEIMYEPQPNEAEYVELFNPTSEPVDLNAWKLSDRRDTPISSAIHVISFSPIVIGAAEYVVVAADSSIFKQFGYLSDSRYHVIVKKNMATLNNTGDSVIVSDLTGRIIDILFYLPTWHNPEVDDVAGRALERINPFLPTVDKRNWSTSASLLGGTPGLKNSLYATAVPSAAAISFSPNPFSPDGDSSGAFLPSDTQGFKTIGFSISEGTEDYRRSHSKESARP
ncbi:MAG: lamin tail domain-containing protein [Ignavibacteriae bacterium]|nr:lamin tail domain-containing protein [Ignavibacteria bacterium]MBI3365258.1 lamin tail domain-containing protein [Ignavibacteriota bacterium]